MLRFNWHLGLNIGLGLICLDTLTTNTFAKQHMQQENIQIIVKQARDAWVARDADALAQLFTPDGELIVPGQRWQGQTNIREAVTRFAQQYTDVKIEIKRIIIEDNQAAVEWTYEDTEKATGIRNKAEDAIFVDLKNGRINRWREYFDTKIPTSKP